MGQRSYRDKSCSDGKGTAASAHVEQSVRNLFTSRMHKVCTNMRDEEPGHRIHSTSLPKKIEKMALQSAARHGTKIQINPINNALLQGNSE